jgi:hypothetical protein
MLRFSRSRLLPVVLSGTVAALTACSNGTLINRSATESQPAQAAPVASSSPAAKALAQGATKTVTPTTPAKAQPSAATAPAAQAQASNLPDFYKIALDKASSARSISESAQSPEDWSLAASRWQQAITLLKKVPATSPDKKLAQAKLSDYSRKLTYAKNRARNKDADNIGNSEIVIDPVAGGSTGAVLGDIPPQQSASGNVYRVWIKYRRGRIPIIDVNFNGKRKFEMMVDTGASGTMITREMAAALGVEVVGEIPIGTASGKALAPVGYIRSIEAGGAMVKNVPVTIGPLDVGLLGHDFFGDCELTIKRDVIEFRQCGAS